MYLYDVDWILLVKIINNFLPLDLFKGIQTTLQSSDIAWFFKPHQTAEKKDHGFFCHTFFYNNKMLSIYHESIILPILDKLKAKATFEARANMIINMNKPNVSDYHVDKDFECKTAILYINNTNAGTEIKGKTIVHDMENKLLLMDSNTPHRSVWQTNKDRRIIININYL